VLILRADTFPRKARHSAGFTLIELLLVLAVMGLLAGLGSPIYSKLKAGADYRNSVRQVMAGLVLARQQAAESGREVRYSCDLDKRVCGLEGAATNRIPEDVTLRATVAGAELKEGGTASIRFYPDGGSTGGFFELARAGGGGARLRVDWLFGRLTQEPLG
jgi:general secretion pathway protein H